MEQMFCKIVEQMFYKVAGLGHRTFECFVTQVQTGLPKTKCVWPMKINVICTVIVKFVALH